MTQPVEPEPRPAPRLLYLGVGLGVACIAWFMLHLYVNPATSECIALYHSARTAADSAVIDQTIPPSGQKNSEPRTCRFLQRSGQWR